MNNAIYRLAKDNGFALVPYGPTMTLDKALAYQADLVLAGFNPIVVNTRAEPAPIRPNRKNKGKAKFTSWQGDIQFAV